MKHSKALFLTMTCFFVVLVSGQNNFSTDDEIVPPTKIEALAISHGVVLLKSFTKIDTLRSGSNTVVVDALDLFVAKQQKHEFGVVLEFTPPNSSRRDGVAYIDYDELDTLLKSMEELARTSETESRLPNFEASYTTRDDVSFKVLNRYNGEIVSLIQFEDGARGSINLNLNDFAKAGQIIANAKLKLDSLRQ